MCKIQHKKPVTIIALESVDENSKDVLQFSIHCCFTKQSKNAASYSVFENTFVSFITTEPLSNKPFLRA